MPEEAPFVVVSYFNEKLKDPELAVPVVAILVCKFAK